METAQYTEHVTTPPPVTADITVENLGSIMTFAPQTEEGYDWLKANTDGEWFGGALVVEHRYARDLAAGAQEDGLTVV